MIREGNSSDLKIPNMPIDLFPPIDLLAEERQETFQLRKELTCTDPQEIASVKEAIRKDGRRKLVEKWQIT